ncbi:MAG: DUF1080 domain-containing protein [Cyclobacteriaceae bacterium]
MNRLFLLPFLLIISCSSPASKTDPIVLFTENGDDWSTEGTAAWSFENDELVARLDSGAGFIRSKASFSDFELTLEFNPDSTINSGVYVRCSGQETTPNDCYEINIWDLHPNQEYRTGAVVLKANPLAHVTTLNKWNTYRIRCEAGRIQAWVNGEQTADLKDDTFSGGYIALQAAEKGEVRFRNIKVENLE